MGILLSFCIGLCIIKDHILPERPFWDLISCFQKICSASVPGESFLSGGGYACWENYLVFSHGSILVMTARGQDLYLVD